MRTVTAAAAILGILLVVGGAERPFDVRAASPGSPGETPESPELMFATSWAAEGRGAGELAWPAAARPGPGR